MKGDIIAVIAALAVILGFVTAVLGFVNQRRANTALKLAEESARVAAKSARVVDTISVNVDGRLSELFERQAQLLGTLHAEGIPIPPAPLEKRKI